jgi:hypothetical protein
MYAIIMREAAAQADTWTGWLVSQVGRAPPVAVQDGADGAERRLDARGESVHRRTTSDVGVVPLLAEQGPPDRRCPAST